MIQSEFSSSDTEAILIVIVKCITACIINYPIVQFYNYADGSLESNLKTTKMDI